MLDRPATPPLDSDDQELVIAFQACYAKPILQVVQDYLKDPKNTAEFVLRMQFLNQAEREQLKKWYEEEFKYKKIESYCEANWIVYGKLCELDLGIGDEAQAREAYQKAGANVLAQTYLGIMGLMKDELDCDQAQDFFREAMKANLALAWHWMGLVWKRWECSQRAKECLLQAGSLGYGCSYFLLYDRVDEFPKSESLKQGIILGSPAALFKWQDGYGLVSNIVHHRMPFYPACRNKIIFFQLALERNYSPAFCSMSSILDAEGHHAKAAEYLVKAAELGNITALNVLANQKFKEQDYAEAEKLYLKIVRINNHYTFEFNDPYLKITANYKLANISIVWHRGTIENATQHFRLAYSADPSRLEEADDKPVDVFSVFAQACVQYHKAVINRNSSCDIPERILEKLKFTELCSNPSIFEGYYKQLHDTPFMLKPLIDEPVFLRILMLPHILASFNLTEPQSIILAYDGLTSTFSAEVIAEEKIAVAKLKEVQHIFNESNALFIPETKQRVETAISKAEKKKMSHATSLAHVFNLFKTHSESSWYILEKKDQEDAKAEMLAEKTVTQLKIVLTGCHTLFGKKLIHERMCILHRAEQNEISSVKAVERIFGVHAAS